MNILIINCGSSTIKFQVINMDTTEVIAKGRCDMIGYDGSNMIYKNVRDNITKNFNTDMPTHNEAVEVLLNTLTSSEYGVIDSLDHIFAVGHRMVHGGEKFAKSQLVTDKLIEEVESLSSLAPLHNPGCIMGVKAIMKIAPHLKNVVVFDTAFHQTIPDFNYIYPIDYKYYEKYRIRRYGFHGTSFKYTFGKLSEYLNKPKENINAIICHGGSGASICAIKNGKSYDTSMGFTPLEGLVMETRSGDIDPAIVTKLMREEGFTPDEVDLELNKKSGRLGICGIGDFRELKESLADGNEKAKLARKIQANKTKKYIGAYMAELNQVDAIVFTGGVFENNADEVEMIISNMECLGIELDIEKNNKSEFVGGKVSKDTSKIEVYVIPTNEELEIALETVEVIKCSN